MQHGRPRDVKQAAEGDRIRLGVVRIAPRPGPTSDAQA